MNKVRETFLEFFSRSTSLIYVEGYFYFVSMGKNPLCFYYITKQVSPGDKDVGEQQVRILLVTSHVVIKIKKTENW